MVTVAGGDFKVETFTGTSTTFQPIVVRKLEEFEFALFISLKVKTNSGNSGFMVSSKNTFTTSSIVQTIGFVTSIISANPFNSADPDGQGFNPFLPNDEITVERFSGVSGGSTSFELSIMIVS